LGGFFRASQDSNLSGFRRVEGRGLPIAYMKGCRLPRFDKSQRRIRLIGAVALLLAGAVVLTSPASAQNFFDLLFGGFRRPPAQTPPPPPGYPPYPGTGLDRDEGGHYGEPAGPSASFCVRTCDGRFFPIRSSHAAEICGALCPGAQTMIFSGSKIDYAVAHDGRSYRELPAAFAFRDKVVSDCTCNGRDPFGLARIDIRDDPTLRPGDIVATRDGLMQATGRRQGEFTPISGEMRRRLSEVKVAPSYDSEAGDDIPGYQPIGPSRAAETPRPQAPQPPQPPQIRR
jgi:hypothetical protein